VLQSDLIIHVPDIVRT